MLRRVFSVKKADYSLLIGCPAGADICSKCCSFETGVYSLPGVCPAAGTSYCNCCGNPSVKPTSPERNNNRDFDVFLYFAFI